MAKSIMILLLLGLVSYMAYDRYSRIPAATIAPSPTPTPTPTVRLAPEGTLYVIEEFSVTTDSGVHGFPAGKKVRLMSRDGLQVTVADDEVQASQPSRKFTNNMDVVEKLQAQNRVREAANRAPVAAQSYTETEQPDPTPSLEQRRKEALRKKRDDLAYRISKLRIEVDTFGVSRGASKLVAPVGMRNELANLERQLELIELELTR